MRKSSSGGEAVARLRQRYQETVQRMAAVLSEMPEPREGERRVESMVAFEEACRDQVRDRAEAGLVLAFTQGDVELGDPFQSDLRDVAGTALASDAARVARVRWYQRERARTDGVGASLSRDRAARAR
jgi:hypothetical protein